MNTEIFLLAKLSIKIVSQIYKQSNWSYDFAESMKENIAWPITGSMWN